MDNTKKISTTLQEFRQASLTSTGRDKNPTLRYYEDHAEEFTAATIDADMEDIRRRFLAHLSAGARILDFGCGTGRDTKAFRELAYEVTALDGSESLCRIAGDYAGVPVRCMDFREYFPAQDEYYDGIWACASLLHLKKKELLPVMHTLGRALTVGGVLYVSFKYGNYEGDRNGRHFTDFTAEGFQEYLTMLPEFKLVEYWVTGDVRPGRRDERWLNTILERTKIHM
ncbi:MAG: methyltransferase domain-containing protein [Blautia sp.]|nr:methyltransferase domain-containing protein [Blautia sp.]